MITPTPHLPSPPLQGVLQYFIGVQLDASTYVDPTAAEKKLEEGVEQRGTVEVVGTAANVGEGLLELPDAGMVRQKEDEGTRNHLGTVRDDV